MLKNDIIVCKLGLKEAIQIFCRFIIKTEMFKITVCNAFIDIWVQQKKKIKVLPIQIINW